LRRRGQEEIVQVYHLLCEGTVDYDVHKVAGRREVVSAQALGEELFKDEREVDWTTN